MLKYKHAKNIAVIKVTNDREVRMKDLIEFSVGSLRLMKETRRIAIIS